VKSGAEFAAFTASFINSQARARSNFS
jgi:hypothetical protein